MTEPYFTEDAKLAMSPFPPWTLEECGIIHRILTNKGYYMNNVSRMGCDRKYHDAWQVMRDDVPRLVEELFKRRIAVEVQAEGRGMASIIFVYDYSAVQIISAVNNFWENNNEETRVHLEEGV